MDEPAADTLATLAAGRTAAVAELRQRAARFEALPLDAAAEVLVLLGAGAGRSPAAGGLRARAHPPGR